MVGYLVTGNSVVIGCEGSQHFYLMVLINLLCQSIIT